MILKGLVIRARFAFLALKASTRICLGDLVWYKGKRWVVGNGVTCPTWTLYLYNYMGTAQDRRDVHESEFRKVRTPWNYWCSFRSQYSFYMTSWYSILLYKSLRVTFLEPIHGWLYGR